MERCVLHLSIPANNESIIEMSIHFKCRCSFFLNTTTISIIIVVSMNVSWYVTTWKILNLFCDKNRRSISCWDQSGPSSRACLSTCLGCIISSWSLNIPAMSSDGDWLMLKRRYRFRLPSFFSLNYKCNEQWHCHLEFKRSAETLKPQKIIVLLIKSFRRRNMC